ncbi:MlaD family protein [Mycobacteroides abscessus]|uniref:MlaD family protein n=1 Tax=Mycobacteroides abscessus TaxID=36809 RepID=UPI00092A3419|nr:MlaD family protein [Mycobacteroides abscessus]SKS08210.1 Mce family protein [Mycobacteroides abscessus subsp. abscessus]SHU87039.1 Mce family protein [Mycobacteroides abscessus subsp. bolletii]SHW22149.1 Mce family protein [Mycobacteroides abscessus subsp. bolletii]SHW47449.1 Mce family protein [Mycobacteroides abscessus subsp. bolletii]SHX91875.1 Mce family protein [Mycobacteroides abscessus subsp. bolletii]
MLTRAATARLFALLLAVATAGASTSCSVAERAKQTVARTQGASGYCAILSDSIGLYPGNSVTRMGVPIGQVDHVEALATSVRVAFTLDHGVSVPGDVFAVTRTPTILADRTLELTGGHATGHLLQGDCIPMQRTETAKSITESTAAITNVVRQLSDAGRGQAVDRLVRVAAAQLDDTGPGMRDALSSLAGAVDDPRTFNADQLIRDIATTLRGITANWADLESLLRLAPSGLDSLSLGLFQAVSSLIGPRVNPIFQVLLDMATHLHDIVWNTLDTATATVRLLSEHTGVIVMYAGTLPNILDGIRNFWARVRTREIPIVSPRVEAGPSDNGTVCSRTSLDPQGKDHCGFFYGVPDGVTSVDLLQLVLNGGVKNP